MVQNDVPVSKMDFSAQIFAVVSKVDFSAQIFAVVLIAKTIVAKVKKMILNVLLTVDDVDSSDDDDDEND